MTTVPAHCCSLLLLISCSLMLRIPCSTLLRIPIPRTAQLEPSPYLINVTRTLYPSWEWVGGSLAGSMPMWYEFYNEQTNTSIVVIQGTSTLADAYFDLQIWFTVFWLKNVVFPMIPFLSLLTSQAPTTAALSLIAGSGSLLPPVYFDTTPGILKYVRPVADYALQNAKGDPSRTIIAGHSLGGSIAELVGSIIDRPAVSIEGPGVVEAQIGMLRYPWVRINGAFVTEANGDIVPHLGSHSGNAQEVDCQGFPQIPFASCHVTIGAVLAKNCGSPERQPGHQWQDMPMDAKTKQMQYCPGLPAEQEALPWSVQKSLSTTSSNYFWGENAHLFNSTVQIKRTRGR